MNKFKIFAVSMVICMLLPIPFLIGKNAYYNYVDPFSLRKPARYAVANVINNYHINNIIIGNSLTQNMVASEVEEALDWRNFFSLTVPGLMIREKATIAAYALRKHEIENVIFSIRLHKLSELPVTYSLAKKYHPDFLKLYDDNPLNDIIPSTKKNRNPWSKTKSKKYLSFIDVDFDPEITADKKIKIAKDLFSPWINQTQNHFNRPLFIQSLSLSEEGNKTIELETQHMKNMDAHFETSIKPLLDQYPNVQFYFVIPPISFAGVTRYKEILPAAVQHISELFAPYKNVRLYSFMENEFNADLRLFKDIRHAHIEVSRYMIQSLKTEQDLITLDNVESYAKSLYQRLGTYAPKGAWDVEVGHTHKTSPYTKKGCLTYYDAAKLTWGDKFSDDLFHSIPRSRYMAQGTYLNRPAKTSPALNASQRALEKGCL